MHSSRVWLRAVKTFPGYWLYWTWHFIYSRLFPVHCFDHFDPIPYSPSRDEDFGGIENKGIQTVSSPKALADLSDLFSSATREAIPLNICAAGHSQNGSTLSKGLRVSLATLPKRMEMISSEIVRATANISLRDVTRFLAVSERFLPVIGDNLSITIGGYASASGIGFSCVQHGLFVDSIEEIEIMLVGGQVIRCSRDINSEIFHGALGGMGMLGCIISVDIRTIPRRPIYLETIYFRVSDGREMRHYLEYARRNSSLKLDYFFACGVQLLSENLVLSHIGTQLVDHTRDAVEDAYGEARKELSKMLGTKITVAKRGVFPVRHNRLTLPFMYPYDMVRNNVHIWKEFACELSTGLSGIDDLFDTYVKQHQAALVTYIIKNRRSLSAEHHSFALSQGFTEDFQLGYGLYFNCRKYRDDRILELCEEIVNHSISTLSARPYLQSTYKLTKDQILKVYPKVLSFLKLKKAIDPRGILNSDFLINRLDQEAG